MLRRSLYRLFTLSESRGLLGIPEGGSSAAAAAANPPLLMMPTVLQILKEHHACKDDVLLQRALEQIVALDRTSLDSAMVALCRIPKKKFEVSVGTDPSTMKNNEERQDQEVERENVVLSLMRYFVHSVPMREYCCRCLANMSLLSLPQSPAAGASPPNNGEEGAKPQDVAAQLVRDGALEQVLGTLHMGARLSRRGQCWAAMALLNLLCLSPNGIRRLTGVGMMSESPQGQPQHQAHLTATSSNNSGVEAMDTIAEFILAILDEETFLASSARHQKKVGMPSSAADPKSNAANPSAFSGFPAEQVTAVDAAIGALTILLQAEAPENAKGVHSHAELVHFTPILAVCKTLLMASALMVRDGRNDGAYSVSLPKRREGLSVRLSQCSPHQGAAIVALLPLLHKAWVAMRVLCRHTPNLPLVFESMMECTRVQGEAAAAATATPEEIAEVSPARPHASFGFHSLIEATLFLLSELDGLSEMKPFNASLVQVHTEVCEAAMEVLAAWTAAQATPPQEMESSSEAGQGSEGSASSSPSPSAAYDVVLDELCSGTVSSIALSTAVRVHADQCEKRTQMHKKNANTSTAEETDRQTVHLPAYDLNAHVLLSKSLQTLQNLIEIGNRPLFSGGDSNNNSAEQSTSSRAGGSRVVDEVAVSPNTVAALQVMLRNGVEVLEEIANCSASAISAPPQFSSSGSSSNHGAAAHQEAVVEDLSYLFVARGGGAKDSSSDESTTTDLTPNPRREAQSFLLLQESALLGQVCAILYSLMRQEAGAKAILDDILAGEPDVAAESSVPAGGALMDLMSSLQERLRGTFVAALERAKVRHSDGSWSTTREEETLVCLTELTDKMLQSLHMLKNLQQQREAALKNNAAAS